MANFELILDISPEEVQFINSAGQQVVLHKKTSTGTAAFGTRVRNFRGRIKTDQAPHRLR